MFYNMAFTMLFIIFSATVRNVNCPLVLLHELRWTLLTSHEATFSTLLALSIAGSSRPHSRNRIGHRKSYPRDIAPRIDSPPLNIHLHVPIVAARLYYLPGGNFGTQRFSGIESDISFRTYLKIFDKMKSRNIESLIHHNSYSFT